MTLKERFARTITADTKSTAVLLPNAKVLKEISDTVFELQGRSPPASLPEEERNTLSRQYSPLIHSVLERCAEGLVLHPEIASETGVTQEICLQTAQVIDASGKLAKNAGDVYQGASDGLRVVSSQSYKLGEEVLGTVLQIIHRGDAGFDLVALDTAFAEAIRRYQVERDRVAKLKQTAQTAVAKEEDRAEDARKRVQESELIDKFLKTNNKED